MIMTYELHGLYEDGEMYVTRREEKCVIHCASECENLKSEIEHICKL